MAKIIKLYKQDAPYNVLIELTEGCNLWCSFCGHRGIRKKRREYQFMQMQTMVQLVKILHKTTWNPRFEFAMRGEPTANPKWMTAISILRNGFPKASIMLTTNGMFIRYRKTIKGAFKKGLNTLMVDDYTGLKRVDRLWPDCLHYPKDKDANPYRRVKHDVRRVIVLPNIRNTDKGVHNKSWMCNHCGAAAPLNDKQAGKRCTRPFRDFVVTFDGEVLVCCNDWRRQLPAGNIHDVRSAEEIWQNKVFQATRQHLYHGKRSFFPCMGCDATSKRAGLLPDRMGKKKLPYPGVKMKNYLLEAFGKGPLTEPVIRPWEE